jgi:hypothetical protein
MVTATSTESYLECKSEGLIGDRQFQVLAFILNNQEMYPKGICRGDVARFFTCTRSGYARRVQELEVLGILELIGTKEDEITGRTVKAYKPTGKVPTERAPGIKRVTTVEIKTWWAQDDDCRLGPFFTPEEAKAAQVREKLSETTMKIATAQLA